MIKAQVGTALAATSGSTSSSSGSFLPQISGGVGAPRPRGGPCPSVALRCPSIAFGGLWAPMHLTPEHANRFATATPRPPRPRPYPYKMDLDLAGPEDAAAPAASITPIFHGSFGRHSCVHGWWRVLRLARRFLIAPSRPISGARAGLCSFPEQGRRRTRLSRRPYAMGFERPYGWAWLLARCRQATATTPRGRAALDATRRRASLRCSIRFCPSSPIRCVGFHFSISPLRCCLARHWAPGPATRARRPARRARATTGSAATATTRRLGPGGDEFLSLSADRGASDSGRPRPRFHRLVQRASLRAAGQQPAARSLARLRPQRQQDRASRRSPESPAARGTGAPSPPRSAAYSGSVRSPKPLGATSGAALPQSLATIWANIGSRVCPPRTGRSLLNRHPGLDPGPAFPRGEDRPPDRRDGEANLLRPALTSPCPSRRETARGERPR